jgi:hypothetical protein
MAHAELPQMSACLRVKNKQIKLLDNIKNTESQVYAVMWTAEVTHVTYLD